MDPIDSHDVRAARHAAGLTMLQAAELVHCRYRTWQDWEAGINPPDRARYRLFCHLTGLERIPFGTIRADRKSPDREAAELSGKIDSMLEGQGSAPTV